MMIRWWCNITVGVQNWFPIILTMSLDWRQFNEDVQHSTAKLPSSIAHWKRVVWSEELSCVVAINGGDNKFMMRSWRESICPSQRRWIQWMGCIVGCAMDGGSIKVQRSQQKYNAEHLQRNGGSEWWKWWSNKWDSFVDFIHTEVPGHVQPHRFYFVAPSKVYLADGS